MTQKNVDKIRDKIAKLLAKANGTDNRAEASSFMAKVEELLTAHQLEIGDIAKKDQIERTVIFMAPKTLKEWHKNIPNIVARYYGCQMIMVRKGDVVYMTAIGRESTRVTADMMMPFILDQLRAEAAEYQKKTLFSRKRCMQDICDAFYLRLQDLIRAREKVEASHGRTDRALTLLDESEVWLNEMFPDIKETKGKPLNITDLAVEHAKNINLDKQVGGGTGDKPLLLAAS